MTGEMGGGGVKFEESRAEVDGCDDKGRATYNARPSLNGCKPNNPVGAWPGNANIDILCCKIYYAGAGSALSSQRPVTGVLPYYPPRR